MFSIKAFKNEWRFFVSINKRNEFYYINNILKIDLNHEEVHSESDINRKINVCVCEKKCIFLI